MLDGLSILLMGLYGTGSGDALYVPQGLFGNSVSMGVDLERTDVEGLLIYQLPNFPLYVFVGSRYVLLKEHMKGSNATASVRFDIDSEITIVKAGIGSSADLNDDGRHRPFGNVPAGVGFAKSRHAFALVRSSISKTPSRTGARPST